MAKFTFVVFTTPQEGEDEAYNEWYDNQHVPDLLAIDGVTAATRYDLAGAGPGTAALSPYLALYEVEAENVDEILAKLGTASAEGKMPTSDALDASKTVSAFYLAHQH